MPPSVSRHDGAARRLRLLTSKSIQRSRIVLYRVLSDCSRVEGVPVLHQPCLLRGEGRIEFEDNVRIGFAQSPRFFSTYTYIEARNVTACVSIGSGTHLNNDCVVVAEHNCIFIGRNVLLGIGVEILDSDFHAIDSSGRREGVAAESADVSIGDDCFLGSNVRVMKGVTIGDRSVVGNGSLVACDIPSNVVAAGIPARVLRPL